MDVYSNPLEYEAQRVSNAFEGASSIAVLTVIVSVFLFFGGIGTMVGG